MATIKKIGRIGKPSKKKNKLDQLQEKAKSAVKYFENQRSLLEEMREEFESEYPEAIAALDSIKRQEDTVMEAIGEAKILIAELGKSIGGFIAKPRNSTAGYSSKKFTDIVTETEDMGTVQKLLARGAIKEIALTKDATAWFAAHPKVAERYLGAWEDSKAQTTAVTVPKLE